MRGRKYKMKKTNHKTAILYVLLLSVQVPFNIAFFLFAFSAVSSKSLPATGKSMTFLYFVIAVIYFVTLGVLGIMNIIKSFQAYAQRKAEYSLKTMLILKYGMVPFFVVNFLSITLLFLIAFAATKGIIIIAAFPIVIVMLLFAVFCTWLAMIPGTFYSIQVIRFGMAEGKISSGWAVWHTLLQFFFLTDILDTMYLAVRKWHRGKVGAVIIGGIYTLVIGYIIWLIFHL